MHRYGSYPLSFTDWVTTKPLIGSARAQKGTGTTKHVCHGVAAACLQEVLQQLPWHSDVVESFASYTARQTISSGGGRASSSSTGFGGHLRLKMGLAEGVPGEIAPDHLVGDQIRYVMLGQLEGDMW